MNIADNAPLVHWVLKNKVRVPDYEDAYQDGMIGLWRACETYDPTKGPFGAYAIRCITNEILSRRRRPHLPTYDGLDVVDENADPARQYEYKETLEVARRADKWGLLPYLEQGYTQEEIAQELGCSQPVISKRLRKIREAIEYEKGT